MAIIYLTKLAERWNKIADRPVRGPGSCRPKFLKA